MLIVLASLVLFLAGFSVWVARQLLDTDEWVETSSALVRDPAVQQATASYVAEQLVDQDALTGRLQELLPDRVDALAAPAAGGLAELAERATLRALRSGAFQTLWADANRLANEQLVELVEGEANRAVVFDLRPMLGRVAARIGLGPDVVDRLPDDRGVITIVRPEELETVRSIGRGLRALALVLVRLSIVLFVAAVWLGRERRRRALLQAGLGILLAGLLVLVARRLAGAGVVDALASNGAAEPAARATWEIGTSLLREIAAGVVALGVAVLVCAWLAGPGRVATRVRGWIAPALRDQPAIAYAVALAVLLVLLAVGILPGAARIVLVVLYVVLVVAGVAALRRQVIAESAG
jgi:hypothetical protein